MSDVTNAVVTIVSEDEAFWLEIKDSCVKDIGNLKKMLKFQQAILELAEKNLLSLKDKAKYSNNKK